MSVMRPTGSACVDRFRSWALARLPEPQELDDLRASIEFYQPEDLPEMIEIVREAQRVCMAGQEEVRVRVRDELEQQGLKDELLQRGPKSIEDELRWFADVEFCTRWSGRVQFLLKVLGLLEKELQGYETAGGSD
jgi:hypothetical protein